MPLALGGMARIYIGRTTGIGSFERHVVLKLITPERANDHTAVQMFLDEARLAAALNHQNVAQVFEVGEDGGIHYLAMEYVHGQDLRALLAKAGSQGTRVPLELALAVITGAAAGLNHAHERRGQDGVPLGIVHRDVSPSNIMVGYDGSVKLLDFGIAKATQRSVETQSGIIKGKFAYMAPEQCRGRDVDRRSDVFSLGIILYEITTQHRCFRADSDFDTMHRIVTGDVVRPTRLIQGYPQALEAVVMKALSVDPQQRYQSAGALLEALESFAVSSRMSLSTMSLGRFMRDMFGDLTEPWLTQQGRQTQQPQLPRESTISNTNGSDVNQPRAKTPLPLELSEQQLESAMTVLELPGSSSIDELEYPTPRPGYDAPLRLETDVNQAATPPHPAPVVAPIATPQDPVPRAAFSPVPGSGSGPAHGMIPSTRHGYTSGAPSHADVAYPRYEPPPGSIDDAAQGLRPNRRPLFVGLGIAAVGLVVLLVMTLGGDDGPTNEQPIIMDDKGSDHGSATTGSAAVVAPDPKPAPPPVPVEVKVEPQGAAEDQSVTIDIESEPKGADVILAGKVIGTTPFKSKRARAQGLSMITVHKARFIDVTTEIDLSSDYTSDITLKPAPEPVTRKPTGTPTPRPTTNTVTPPKKKDCQSPAQYNPLDDRPVCK